MNAYTWLMRLLDEVGSQPRGKQVRQCVAHRDSSPSMSVRPYPDGSVSLKCFGGCTTEQMLAALHITGLRLRKPAPVTPAQYKAMTGIRLEFPPLDHRGGHPAARGMRLESVHDYEVAVLERWRARDGSKDLRWERRLPSGALIPGLGPLTLDCLPLYRQREVTQGMAAGEVILLVESESSADSLRGWYSTTWPGSAHVVNVDRLAKVLAGYPHLVVIPDHDTAGLACLTRLQGASLAKNVLLPAPGEDAHDLFRRLGHKAFAEAVQGVLARALVNDGRWAA